MNFKDQLEIASYLATIVGGLSFPLAVILYFQDRKKRREEEKSQREERELSTNSILGNQYADFLKLCLEYSELDIYSYKHKNIPHLNPMQKIQKLILYDFLVSMFESAFNQYKIHTNEFKQAQWSGWNEYIKDYCKDEEFRFAWENYLSSEYDTNFMMYMEGVIKESKK